MSNAMEFATMRIQIMSADITLLLSAIGENGICLTNIEILDPLTLMADVGRKQYGKLSALVASKGGTINVVARKGSYWRFVGLRTRPVLLVGIALLLFLTVLLPSRILFVTVTGNEQVPSHLILECAENIGLGFGASRRTVRSEMVKNSLLDQIPMLQWVGVNSRGCVAEISVKERPTSQKKSDITGISSIVAVRDGVISACTATKGNLVCAPGQAVAAGDVLISAYTDLGLCIRATRAQGEVFATTQRQLTLYMPDPSCAKKVILSTSRKISLIIGKKRINLYNEGGILGSICDRIYEMKYITLPGGFRLPFGIAVEEIKVYDISSPVMDHMRMESAAMEAAADYLAEQMLSGQILSSKETHQKQDGYFLLRGCYVCSEMIGIMKQEEIIGSHG